MYKLCRRQNLIPFLVIILIGVAACVALPPQFKEQVFEVPSFALFPAEIALVLIFSVFFFENNTPAELLRLSFTMLALAMFSGSVCNVINKTSQTLPEHTLLLNWVQLLCMNVTGIIATIAFYQTSSPQAQYPNFIPLKKAAPKQEGEDDGEDEETGDLAAKAELGLDKIEVASGESAKEILAKLDIDRINNQEAHITKQAIGGQQSLESLFADESHDAQVTTTVDGPRAGSLDDLLNFGDTPSSQPVQSTATIPAPPQTATGDAAVLTAEQVGVQLDHLFVDIIDDTPPVAEVHVDVTLAATPPVAVAAPADDLFAQVDTPAVLTDDLFAQVDTPVSAEAPADDLFAQVDAPAVVTDDLFAQVVDTPVATVSATDDLFAEPDTPAPAETPKVEAPISPVATPAAAPELSTDDLFAQLELPTDDLFAPAAQETPPTPAAEPLDAAAAAKLFDDSALGGDLEDIFSNLAPEASKDDFSVSKLADIKASQPAESAEPPAASADKPTGKLFEDESLAGDLDDIFKTLAPEADQQTVPPSQPAPTGSKEVKEFGRLSVVATAKTDLAAPGTLKTIGQMLLDTQAVENIIKHSEGNADELGRSLTTAKVVSVSRGADIQAMLDKVASYPDVIGSLVIGKDGLIIAATESLGPMRDVLGVLALGMHATTSLGTQKIDMGNLRQAVLRTGDKLTVLTEIGIGVLATFSDVWKVETIDGMIEHITKVITDSQASGGTALPTEQLTGGLLAESAKETMPAPPQAPEPTPSPAVAEDTEAVISISESQGGLLNVNDDEIGGLFDNILAGPEPATPSPVAAPAKPTPVPEPAMEVGDDMASLFDDVLDSVATPSAPAQPIDFTPPELAQKAPAEAPKAEPTPTPTEAPAETPAPTAAPASETPSAPGSNKPKKEFGRLSVTSATNQAAGEGSIKAIGRQLIDIQAVENIIKSGEKREKMGSGMNTARVISAARGEGIKALLTKIDGCAGVAGSLIVGNDGLVIASTLTSGPDKDLLGALCSAMHSHTELAAQEVKMGKLKQVIFHANDKTTILTAVAVGVLAVFVENHDLAQVDALLVAIEQTVRG